MCKIFGYREDAFTLWVLEHRTLDILETFQDRSALSDCLIFYRPSFGRHGSERSAAFGEFDAILVSSENIYLIESKWDNVSECNDDEIIIDEVQKLRHRIFTWYITHWDRKYCNNWKRFVKENQADFQRKFHGKPIAPMGSLLATNLEFILNKFQEHCKNFSSNRNIKNVLLFFHNAGTKPPYKTSEAFRLMNIDYSQEFTGNFVPIEQ